METANLEDTYGMVARCLAHLAAADEERVVAARAIVIETARRWTAHARPAAMAIVNPGDRQPDR